MSENEILAALENSSLSLEEKQIKEALGVALKNPSGVLAVSGLPKFAYKFEAKLEVHVEVPQEATQEAKSESEAPKNKKGK